MKRIPTWFGLALILIEISVFALSLNIFKLVAVFAESMSQFS